MARHSRVAARLPLAASVDPVDPMDPVAPWAPPAGAPAGPSGPAARAPAAARRRRDRPASNVTASRMISAHTPATAYRSTELASALALACFGAAAGGRGAYPAGADEAGGAVDGDTWLADVMSAARSMARAAFTVPYPAPASDRGGSGGSAPGEPLAPDPDELTVLPTRARVTWAGVRFGNLDRMRAARPATMPLAVLVELNWEYASGGAAATMSTPGAVSAG